MSYQYTTEEFNLTPKEQEAARFLLQEAKVLSSQPQDESWNIRRSTFENFKRQFYRQLATRLDRVDWKGQGLSPDGKKGIRGKIVRDSQICLKEVRL